MTQEQLSNDVTAYSRIVYRLAFGCTGNRLDAEDVVQDTFLRLFHYKKPFVDEEHKKAFLLRVASNLCKDMFKSAWFRKRIDLDETIPAGDCFTNNEDVLRDYVLRLKPAYRAVVFLFYYEEYSTREIADILKMSETAVTTRLNRARNQLRTELTNNKEDLIHEYIC